MFVGFGFRAVVADPKSNTIRGCPTCRFADIPRMDSLYYDLDTLVIRSADEKAALLEDFRQRSYANMADRVIAAFNRLKIDFEHEQLILIRHDEGSGTVAAHPLDVRRTGSRLDVRIRRSIPEVRLAVLDCHCFGIIAPREIDQLVLKPDLQPATTIALGEQVLSAPP